MVIKQYRFNFLNTALNSKDASLSDTIDVTSSNYTKIGIQAIPGTIFRINGVNIIIGKTGIYELENIKINTIYSATKEQVIIDLVEEGVE